MKDNRYKSDTKGELIPVVIIEFRGMPDLWFTMPQWEEIGKYHGFLKEYVISPICIEKVHKIVVNPERFPTNEWEP